MLEKTNGIFTLKTPRNEKMTCSIIVLLRNYAVQQGVINTSIDEEKY